MSEIELVPITSAIEVATGNGLREALMVCDTGRAELATTGDYQQLLAGWQYLKRIKADIDVLMRATEDDITRLMPEKKMVIDGIGLIERRTTSTRKWDSENLMKDLCRSSLDPDNTGEITMSGVANLLANLKAALPLTGSLGWRVTALKELGIDPDYYGEATYGRQTITITGAKK